jgi:hypothetical protein
MTRYIILILLAALIISLGNSCKKENKNIFIGTISEMISGNPAENVEIIIEVNELKSAGFSTGFKEIGRVYTEDDGSFQFETGPYQALEYRFTLIKDKYYTRSFTIEPRDLADTYSIYEEIGLESHLKICIKNSSPINENDQMKYRVKNIHSKCEVCCQTSYRYFYGIDIDTIISCPVTGLNTIQLEHVVIRDTESEHFMQAVYCEPNDTMSVNIFY